MKFVFQDARRDGIECLLQVQMADACLLAHEEPCFDLLRDVDERMYRRCVDSECGLCAWDVVVFFSPMIESSVNDAFHDSRYHRNQADSMPPTFKRISPFPILRLNAFKRTFKLNV